MQIIDVSIVLINYKTQNLLFDCIESIYKETRGITYEIIVVDNDTVNKCKNFILSKFPNVQYFDMGYNSGFARANNKGIRESKGRYILVLNDDTIILENAIKKTFDYYSSLELLDPWTGFLTCTLLSPDGSMQHSSNDWFLNVKMFFKANPIYIFINRKRFSNKQSYNDLNKYNYPHEAKWISGAFLFFNAKLAKEKNLYFDEDFLIYTEDMDLGFRAKKMGYKMLYFPGAKILHINSASYNVARKTGQLMISEWLYIYKRYGLFGYFLLVLVLFFNIICDSIFYLKNLVLLKLTEEDKKSKVYRKILFHTLLKYSFYIPFKFKKKTSASRTFLKYNV